MKKKVFIRLTTDDWQSCKDIPAGFLQQHQEDFSRDEFFFSFQVTRSFRVGTKISFAVGYEATDLCQLYWDNNCAQNFQVECRLNSRGGHFC